jgi:type I restriction enzyme S subunit
MIPAKPVQAAFDAVAGPMFSQIRVLDQAASKAKQARDALLPRLMSGALAV